MIEKLKEHKSAIVYGVVGIVNTIFGYSMMFGLTFIGIMPEISNAISFWLSFIISYLLNKRFTFHSKRTHKKDFIRFIVASAIAYIINLITLIVCHRILLWNEYISLIISGITYVVFGYIFHKNWTFK